MADESTGAKPESGHHSSGSGDVTRNAGKAIAAFTLGIISLLIYGVVVGVVAVVLGVLARREIAETPGASGSGMALAGIIFGAVGFVLSAVAIVFGLGGVVPV